VIGRVAEDLHSFIYEDIMAEIRRQKHLLDLEKDRRRKSRQNKGRSTLCSTMTEDEEDGPLFDVQKLLKGSSKYFVNNTEEENLDSLLRICDTEVLGENNILGILL